MNTTLGDVTQILREVDAGSPGATDRLMRLVYAELKSIARNRLGRGQQCDVTTLVHEAYLRMFDPEREPKWENRQHFFFAAARAMRDILVERARKRGAAKRGGGRAHTELIDAPAVGSDVEAADLIALDDALMKLEQRHARSAKVVMLIFFAGLSRAQVAQQTCRSEAAVWRDWNYARAWLYAEMNGTGEPDDKE